MKGTAESAEESGFEGWKKAKGRKQYIVPTSPATCSLSRVRAATLHDHQGARPLLGQVFQTVRTLRRLRADQAYQGELVDQVENTFSCEVEIVQKTAKTFEVLPRRVGGGMHLGLVEPLPSIGSCLCTKSHFQCRHDLAFFNS